VTSFIFTKLNLPEMKDKKELNYTVFINLVVTSVFLIVFLIWNSTIIGKLAIFPYFALSCVILFNCWESNDILTNISTIVYCIIALIVLTYFILPLESKVSYFEFHLKFSPYLLLCCVLLLQLRRLFFNTFGELKAKSSENENNTVK
jgi:hypothetical protein